MDDFLWRTDHVPGQYNRRTRIVLGSIIAVFGVVGMIAANHFRVEQVEVVSDALAAPIAQGVARLVMIFAGIMIFSGLFVVVWALLRMPGTNGLEGYADDDGGGDNSSD